MSSRVIPFPAPADVHDNCSTLSFPVSLHDAVAFSRARHRRLIAAAGVWALARGVSLPVDHVALWAAVVDTLDGVRQIDGMTGPWRASVLPDFFEELAEWCAAAGCALPGSMAESLWHLFGFLAATARLHPASDPLTELRAAVVVFGTFDRFRPIPSLPPEPTAA